MGLGGAGKSVVSCKKIASPPPLMSMADPWANTIFRSRIFVYLSSWWRRQPLVVNYLAPGSAIHEGADCSGSSTPKAMVGPRSNALLVDPPPAPSNLNPLVPNTYPCALGADARTCRPYWLQNRPRRP